MIGPHLMDATCEISCATNGFQICAKLYTGVLTTKGGTQFDWNDNLSRYNICVFYRCVLGLSVFQDTSCKSLEA